VLSSLAVLTAAGLCAGAAAQIIVDGTAEGAYGPPKAVQNVQTGFGDSNLGLVDYANGSELDVAFACVRGTRFYLALTGNLESNFNKLEVFIDSIPGGQNTLRSDNSDVDFGGLNRMGTDPFDPLNFPGLTFDAGFEADFWLGTTGGGDPYTYYANWAELLTNGGGLGRYLGYTSAASDGTLAGGDNPDGIRATINNSNTGGVTGGSGADDGSGVTTGAEWSIPLSAIGNPGGRFKVFAFINGLGHDFLSNQSLPGMFAPRENLGEPRLVNFSAIAPDFDLWFTVVVCPGDLDCDGDVDLSDLATLLAAFQQNDGGDLDDDGDTDLADLATLLANFGRVCT
jgi:hypothetical protein